jgi:hypothetical protein
MVFYLPRTTPRGTSLTLSDSVRGLAIADLNGDDKPDIAAAGFHTHIVGSCSTRGRGCSRTGSAHRIQRPSSEPTSPRES